ncbi:hypothetical protein ACFOVS_13900, partial [Rhizobium lemnae]
GIMSEAKPISGQTCPIEPAHVAPHRSEKGIRHWRSALVSTEVEKPQTASPGHGGRIVHSLVEPSGKPRLRA